MGMSPPPLLIKGLPNLIKTQFQNGLFTVTRTAKKFSSIPIDQCHEMTNKVIKGGATGLFSKSAGSHTMPCGH